MTETTIISAAKAVRWAISTVRMAAGFMRVSAMIVAATMVSAAAFAAPPRVSATMRPDSILIGDRVDLEVTVEKDMMQLVEFPVVESDEIAPGIEVLEEFPVDTVKVEGRNQLLRKRYVLTSFEAGEYNLSRYPVLYADKNIMDTVYSPGRMLLRVNTMPIDTAKRTIYGVKPPMGAPLKFGEVSGYLLWGLLGLVALGAAVYFALRRLAGRKRSEAKSSAPREAAHVVAMRELEALHNQKLWQSGKHKLYYSRMTDILREYLAGRYGVTAMEMTSDETMEAMAAEHLTDGLRGDLRGLLTDADLVKFAKHIPGGEESEQAYYTACNFVEETKEVAMQANNEYGDE